MLWGHLKLGTCLNRKTIQIAIVSATLVLVGSPAYSQSAAQQLEAWLAKSSSRKSSPAKATAVKPRPVTLDKRIKTRAKKSRAQPKIKPVKPTKVVDLASRNLKNKRVKSKFTQPKKIIQKVQLPKRAARHKIVASKPNIRKAPRTQKSSREFSVRDLFMNKFSATPQFFSGVAAKPKTQVRKTGLKLVSRVARPQPAQLPAKAPRKATKPVEAVAERVAPPAPRAVAPGPRVAAAPSMPAQPTEDAAWKPASTMPVSLASIEAARPASKDVLTNAMNIVNRRTTDGVSGKRPGSPNRLSQAAGTFVDRVLNPNLAYHFNDREAEYANVKIQFVDDRSSLGQGQVYPVGGVHAHLVGTDLKMAADAKGHIELTSMPTGSRFYLRIQDPARRVESRLVEVKVKPGVQRVSLYRKNQMQILMQAASVKPFPGTGNLCGVVKRRGINLDGVAVALNAQFDGPFYFDRSGVLDPRMRVTGSNGLFCMFNVDPGIKLISLFQGSSHMVDLPTTFQAQSSSFQDLDIAGIGGLRLATRTVPSTSSHLPVYAGSTGGLDMIPLGYSLPFTMDQRGVYSSSYEVVRMDDRVRLFSRGVDIEPAIYNMEKSDTAFVADILPRGYMQDLALSRLITTQKGFGHVFGRYGYLAGRSDQVTAELYDQKGMLIETSQSASAIQKDHEDFSFFNVRPGAYMIVLKDKAGDWLQSQTVLVYADATSVLSLGSKTTFQ
jgi:hypothetical protein